MNHQDAKTQFDRMAGWLIAAGIVAFIYVVLVAKKVVNFNHYPSILLAALVVACGIRGVLYLRSAGRSLVAQNSATR